MNSLYYRIDQLLIHFASKIFLKIKWQLSVLYFVMLFTVTIVAQTKEYINDNLDLIENISIIPKPNSIEIKNGFFYLNKETQIVVSNDKDDLIAVAKYLASEFEKGLGTKLEIIETSETNSNRSPIKLNLVDTPLMNSESYTLIVNSENVTIEANHSTGLFYGVQSLIQLFSHKLVADKYKTDSEWKIPALLIKDSPRYSWRGLMLDESRHFFGKEAVRNILDLMALHKMNRFHWHLTDAPAWRIEIKKYPKLTEIGAFGSWEDPDAPRQFYTQEEIKEIVNYATERHIVVIPEIDMPGHATAANKAYPEFSGGGSKQHPEFTFNPGNEATYVYLTDILKEVKELFPGKWIHYGGDEVHFGNEQWANDPYVISKMKEEGFTELKEIENYFNRRMADVISDLGKTTIGWDEIVDAGVSPENAILMWWRHNLPEQRDKAIQNNFNVVLCPRIPTYFDFVQHDTHQWGRRWQGNFVELTNVYNYPVLPESYTEEQLNQITGIQACVWSERIQNVKRMEFMTFPRMSALAEAAWTMPENKNIYDFTLRLRSMLKRMDDMNIYYFNPFDPESTPEPIGVEK